MNIQNKKGYEAIKKVIEDWKNDTTWINDVPNYFVKKDVGSYIGPNGEYVLVSSDEAVEQKKAEVRKIRNQYLKQYVDDRAKSPFMWDEVSEEEKVLIGEYRKYLMDYPETNGWYENPPKDFSTWKEMLTEEEWNEPKEPDPSEPQEEAGI